MSLGPSSGKLRATTVRLDSIVPQQQIFFLKIDVESREEYVLGGIMPFVERKLVKHIAIGDSGPFHILIYVNLYRLGYVCRNYGPQDSSNVVKGTECDIPSRHINCTWNTLHEMEVDLRRVSVGHFNVLCSI